LPVARPDVGEGVSEPTSWQLRDAIRPGVSALKRYWAPFLLIQICCALLVVAYYQLISVREWADAIGDIKDRWGILFSGLGGFIAGGVIPEIAKAITGRNKTFDRQWLASTAFNGFVYLVIAIQVDLFYRFQGYVFGEGIDVGTILIKTLVDQLIFSPALCMPTGVVLFDWRAARFSVPKAVAGIHRVWYRTRVLPAVIPGLAFWGPFLLALYALPGPLQMPFALLGEAAWSLLFVFIATQEAG